MCARGSSHTGRALAAITKVALLGVTEEGWRAQPASPNCVTSARKPDPATVSVNPASAMALVIFAGETLVTVETGFETLNTMGFEARPTVAPWGVQPSASTKENQPPCGNFAGSKSTA